MLRRFIDIRSTALLLGWLQFSWALIPLIDYNDRSLFAKTLGASSFENAWVSVCLTLGFFMMLSSVIKWRRMLLWTEALSCFAWAAAFAPFLERQIITPVTMSMPAFSIVCLLILVREVIVGVRVKAGQTAAAGIRDIQGAA